MIEVICSILGELLFIPESQFTFVHNDNGYDILAFSSNTDHSQVYLVLPILESKLLHIQLVEFFPQIAIEFRKTGNYISDMEKNTSLLFCVERDVNSNQLTQMQINIEDDPYYFKKYVLSYNSDDKQKYEQLKYEYGCRKNIEFIQLYITSSDNFQQFKDNYVNENMYHLISDLIIKIPNIPIEFRTSDKIVTVEKYFSNEKISLIAGTLDKIVGSLNESVSQNPKDIADELIRLWNE